MTRVALLWHMHQPFYQDLLTGEHILPWVRLHALKDYWGMVALLREFPAAKVTFNLVPSLLVQLEAFAREEARDRHLDLGLKPADQLTLDERAFCIANFFHAQRARMIDPYPRYRELLEQRGDGRGLSAHAQAIHFTTQDLRDLQVWHKLVWIDQSYHDHDPRIRALLDRERGFTEDDKASLRGVELELLRNVIPEFAAAAARGQVELSSSPFYHPILPLLCDTNVYLRAHPHSRMPRESFRYPEDAAEQLQRAAALHERLFGHRPLGLWPSEGSVSDAMVPLVADAGFRWMATDETILARSLGMSFDRSGDGHVDQPERLYQAYAVAGGHHPIACGFRDHALSDLIGFTYASWSAEGAADDFVYRLVTAGRRHAARSGGEEATVFVILDGENAWEHYDRQGRPFLRALYTRLAAHPEIKTVTMSEACASPKGTLTSLYPGSWINADFYIWMGHPDDHRAWSQLADARRTIDRVAPTATPAALTRAREEMFIAEGSDWFWWYGDDHSSEHDEEFDDLFRRHVRNVYRALDHPIPEELFLTNITTQPPVVPVEPATGFIEPTIDGEVTSYFEWIGAGSADTNAAPSTMHKVGDEGATVQLIKFGFALDRLFVRVDGQRPLRHILEENVELRLRFIEPVGVQVVVHAGRATRGAAAGQPSGVQAQLERRHADTWQPVDGVGLMAAAGDILEVQIPFACLGATPHTRLAFLVAVIRAGQEVEHHPRQGPIELEVPDGTFPARSWTA
jgi:alpha-amylase/alpha-mannosidase (GH57 family)